MAPPKVCKYLCNGFEWELISGNAPPGFYCPEIAGVCDEPGEIVLLSPEPIPENNPADPELINSAEYQYDAATDSLYFSRGEAEKGYRLLPKIAMSKLWEQFPAVAAEVELLKNAKSLANFTVVVPAARIA